MTDITGAYDLHDGSHAGLVIRGVDGAHALQDSFIRVTNSTDIIPITGTFDPTTNAISFSTAHFPGDILLATFYTGFAMPDAASLGGVLGFAGVWHAQRIQFQGAGGKKVLKLVSQSGGWFANNHAQEIQ